jgi:hypothetical protein
MHRHEKFQDWLRRRAQLPHLSQKKRKKKEEIVLIQRFSVFRTQFEIFMFSDMFGMIYRSTPLLNTWSANTATTYSIAQF